MFYHWRAEQCIEAELEVDDIGDAPCHGTKYVQLLIWMFSHVCVLVFTSLCCGGLVIAGRGPERAGARGLAA
jgi:hypothetical protein